MKLADIERVRLVEGLDRDSSRTYRLWESAGHVLKEYQLTPAQIDQFFQQVEADATAAGGNRTAIGQGVDAATAASKAIKTAYDDLVNKVQNSGPMQNMDAMYDQAAEKLKQATGGDQGVMQYVQKYRDFAAKHPVAQSFIYSALIAAAGIGGAGLGGAAVLGLLKMSDQLLQGKQFSTALGKGAMTGATALAAGQVGQAVQGADAGYQVDAGGAAKIGNQSFAAPGPSADIADAGAEVAKQAANAGQQGAQSAATTAVTSRAQQAATDTAADSVTDMVSQVPVKAPRAVKEYVDANTTVRMWKLKESLGRPRGGIQLTEAGVDRVFEVVAAQSVNEGIVNTVKGAVSKVGGAIAQTGRNITTTFTADKLKKAWQTAGSNADSEAIKQFLQQQGVTPAIIASAMQKVGIKPAATAAAAPVKPAAPAAPVKPAAPVSAAPAPVAR